MALLFGFDKINARKNFTVLTNFAKLNATVQAEIVQFTDDNNGGTSLIKFCNDLQNTSGLIAFVNETKHLKFVKAFLGYRQSPQYEDADYDKVRDDLHRVLINYGSGVFEKVKHWHDHAVTTSKKRGKFQEGIDFGNWVEGELSGTKNQNTKTPTYQALKNYFDTQGWNLDGYSIYSQVQFCINLQASCNGKDNYFVADFVFVKEIVIGNTTVLDVRIADTKLTAFTDFTDNQEDAMGIKPNSFYIKILNQQSLIKGTQSDFFQTGKKIPNEYNFYKIYSNGTPTSYGGVKK